jgi:hypothetical protein
VAELQLRDWGCLACPALLQPSGQGRWLQLPSGIYLYSAMEYSVNLTHFFTHVRSMWASSSPPAPEGTRQFTKILFLIFKSDYIEAECIYISNPRTILDQNSEQPRFFRPSSVCVRRTLAPRRLPGCCWWPGVRGDGSTSLPGRWPPLGLASGDISRHTKQSSRGSHQCVMSTAQTYQVRSPLLASQSWPAGACTVRARGESTSLIGVLGRNGIDG